MTSPVNDGAMNVREVMVHDRVNLRIGMLLLAALHLTCGAQHVMPERDAESDAGEVGDVSLDTDRGGEDADVDGESMDADDWSFDVPLGWECTSDAVSGDVVVQNLRDLWELAGKGEIDGSLTISSPTFTNLDALSCLRFVQGDFTLEGNENLADLTGLGYFGYVGGDVHIGGNDNLTHISEIGLYTVTGVVHIGGPAEGDANPRLETLDGLDNLDRVGGLVIEGNPVLREVGPLSRLTSYGGVCDLTIRHNSSLTVLFSAPELRSIPTSVVIEDNPSLIDSGEAMLEGLIDGSLIVRRNPMLTSLSSFSRVNYVGQDLVLEDTSIIDLSDLGRLAVIGGSSLVIADNPELPTCQAQALRDRFVEFGWTGSADISGNDDAGLCE